MNRIPNKDRKDIWPRKRVQAEIILVKKRHQVLIKSLENLRLRQDNIERHCSHENNSYEVDPAGGRGHSYCDDCGYWW